MAEYTITYINNDTEKEEQIKVMASSYPEADIQAREQLHENGLYNFQIIKTRKAQFYDSNHYFDVIGDCKEVIDNISTQYTIFGMGEALTEVAKQSVVSSPKIIGKTLFNTGLFASKASLECVRQLPSIIATSLESGIRKDNNPKNLSAEELKEVHDKAKDLATNLRNMKLWKNEKLDD